MTHTCGLCGGDGMVETEVQVRPPGEEIEMVDCICEGGECIEDPDPGTGECSVCGFCPEGPDETPTDNWPRDETHRMEQAKRLK